MDPTLPGFTDFITNVMGITTGQLDPASPTIPLAFNVAMNLVNVAIQGLTNANLALPSLYAYAVYNLAGDRLVNLAQDIAPSTFFADLRKSLGLTSFVSGIIQSTSDEGTSESMLVPDAFKNLTIGDLQLLRTPWGRNYLAIAQDYGSSVWGLS